MEYLFTFLEGFASFISPCVLPLLPIYISYFAGSENKKNKGITNALAFVIGFSIVFLLLAIFANRLGSVLAEWMKYIRIIFGVLIILLGLNYVEIFNFKIFDRFKKFQANVNDLNFIKSLIFGMLFSISMSPCVGTFLTSALLLIATQSNMLKGLLLIMLYCLGLGIPFIVSAVLIDKLKNVFSFIKKHYKAIKIVSGIILIGMGIYLMFFI